jgi:hypothetical protein
LFEAGGSIWNPPYQVADEFLPFRAAKTKPSAAQTSLWGRPHNAFALTSYPDENARCADAPTPQA